MIAEHGDAVEADLARYYQVDFADYYRGRLSLRRLAVLLGWLPPESAIHRIRAAEAEKARQRQEIRELEQTLAMVTK